MWHVWSTLQCGLDIHAGGNRQLVDGLLQDIPVQYDSVVTDVTYGPQGVTVSTATGTFQGMC
jgi:hypothetical protein